MKKFIVLALTIYLCGCFTNPRLTKQCKSWQEEGDFFATVDSCVKCHEKLGADKQAVKGCALGMDASNLLF